MKMKVTTPEDMVSDTTLLEELVQKIEIELSMKSMNRNQYTLDFVGDYPPEVCEEAMKIYRDAGWSKVSWEWRSNDLVKLTLQRS